MKVSRYTRVFAWVLLVLSSAVAAQYDPKTGEAPKPVQSVERFSGSLAVAKTVAAGGLRIAVQNWSLAGGVKLDALELPLRGITVAQLRGGELSTFIDGRRVERTEAEFWTVPAGVAMGLATEDDSAILQTIVVEHTAARDTADYVERTTPRRERTYAQLAHGMLARTLYVTRTPSVRIEIRDLLVGPGGRSGPVDLGGAALLEVRSGRGVLHAGGARDELLLGTTRAIEQGRDFRIENLDAERAIQIRAVVVRPPG